MVMYHTIGLNQTLTVTILVSEYVHVMLQLFLYN